MTKDEYVKKLKKYYDDHKLKEADSYGEGYTDGLAEALVYAIGLAEKLDEPEKVVIPEFIANDIKYHKKYGWTLRGALGSAFDPNEERDVYDWFFADDGDENIRKYISAWDNSYEVENKIEKYVRLKGFEGTINYLNYDVYSKEFFADTTGLSSSIKIKFTKSWLKDNWPEYEAYNNAGLLEFEEVEDE
ncbi:DUF1642 domain-containing protein [Pediococcus pentosaceus]|uniref:DUF1642 domain-containing protein n=1 Tax=Pediococcus pentosaceus TaxID=1255 RepID=UPI00190B55C4|nr:DUF1642 domain-containing protein [Pediococcus pentosaceus]MBF7125558.1 DUF1642 domain-containing protein [Pediococcus pentosaceus]WPK17386.1 DUF1642 domain-containing protein [Pediococcus pentosaceus]